MNWETFKPIIDWSAIGATSATVLGWLPEVTAVLTFLWVVARLYESKMIRDLCNWLFKKKHK